MDQAHAILLNEARCAERLCQRMARLYRKAATTATFYEHRRGSAMLSVLMSKVPLWVSLAGAALFSIATALNVAMRPAEKATNAQADQRRYSKLRTQAAAMDAAQPKAALDQLREADSPEIEPLREVAYNDVMHEVGREDHVVPLAPHQRPLAVPA